MTAALSLRPWTSKAVEILKPFQGLLESVSQSPGHQVGSAPQGALPGPGISNALH